MNEGEGVREQLYRMMQSRRPKDDQPDRSLARIPLVMTQLTSLWARSKEQRLGQFLVNAIGEENLFFIEDAQLIEKLREKTKEWELAKEKREEEKREEGT